MDPLTTPHLAALKAAVEDVYTAFGQGHVSKQLEVCLCPVCMDEDTRQQIIATQTRALSPDLIRAYSNSAHGVPVMTADLLLLLPRYLDLIAQDEMVDDLGMGSELSRFGQALQAGDAAYSPQQRSALDAWARLVILHFGTADALELDNLHTATDFLDMLLVGGWPVQVVTDALDTLFADGDVGQAAFHQFTGFVGRITKETRAGAGLDLFSMRYATDAARTGLAAWLNSAAMGERLADIVTDPASTAAQQVNANTFLTAHGSFEGAAFPSDKDL